MTKNATPTSALAMFRDREASVAAYQAALGKRIVCVAMIIAEAQDDEEGRSALRIEFTGGTRLTLSDAGQNCCERRYMSTDDDLSMFVGATFTGIAIRDITRADDESDDCYEHETQFMIVTTSWGSFTCCSHNEHNGYYGGIYISASAE